MPSSCSSRSIDSFFRLQRKRPSSISSRKCLALLKRLTRLPAFRPIGPPKAAFCCGERRPEPVIPTSSRWLRATAGVCAGAPRQGADCSRRSAVRPGNRGCESRPGFACRTTRDRPGRCRGACGSNDCAGPRSNPVPDTFEADRSTLPSACPDRRPATPASGRSGRATSRPDRRP